jgi:hypothetical protein
LDDKQILQWRHSNGFIFSPAFILSFAQAMQAFSNVSSDLCIYDKNTKYGWTAVPFTF